MSANVAPHANGDQRTQHRVKRKPAPSLDLEARYPTPDPEDPFAPLWALRNRTASYLGNSTSDLESLSWAEGRKFELVRQWVPNNKPVLHDTPQSSVIDLTSPRSPSRRQQPVHHRRRSHSAVFPADASVNSQFGKHDLHAFVLPCKHSPYATLTAEPAPLSQSPTSPCGHASERLSKQASSGHDGPLFPRSPRQLPRSTTEPLPISPTKDKLSRLLASKRSRTSFIYNSSEDISIKPPNASLLSFPSHAPSSLAQASQPQISGRASKSTLALEENTFHLRRKSSTIISNVFPPMDLSNAPARTLDVEPPINSDMGYLSDPESFASRSATLVTSSQSSSEGRYVCSHYNTLSDVAGGFDRQTKAVPSSSSQLFEESAIPSLKQLADAASLLVIAENGLRVPFGSLFKDQRTVVIFIRHFWCPLCQDYMFSISTNVNHKTLKQAGVKLIIIGNGSYGMIKSYRQIFRSPFMIYTDPSLRLYNALGMLPHAVSSGRDAQRGRYVRHGPVGGLAMVVMNALRVRMPILQRGGSTDQLGGEFVMGPGLTCTFAHRMRSPRSHAPITRVLVAAGVNLYAQWDERTSTHRRMSSFSAMSEGTAEKWMEQRRMSLARLKESKTVRRYGTRSSHMSGATRKGAEESIGGAGLHTNRHGEEAVASYTATQNSSIIEEREEDVNAEQPSIEFSDVQNETSLESESIVILASETRESEQQTEATSEQESTTGEDIAEGADDIQESQGTAEVAEMTSGTQGQEEDSLQVVLKYHEAEPSDIGQFEQSGNCPSTPLSDDVGSNQHEESDVANGAADVNESIEREDVESDNESAETRTAVDESEFGAELTRKECEPEVVKSIEELMAHLQNPTIEVGEH